MSSRHQTSPFPGLLLLLPVLLFLLDLPAPGHAIRFPARKTWWTKAITEDLHVAGQPSTKQIKYAKEAGFMSVISLFTVPEPAAAAGAATSDTTPSTANASTLVTGLGRTFHTILQIQTPADGRSSSWATEATLMNFTTAFESSPKPVMFYGHDGYAACFVALLYYAKSSTSGTSVEKVSELFRRGTAFGYNYVDDEALRSLVLRVAGANLTVTTADLPSPPSLNLPKWYASPAMWKLKPIGDNLWLSGQIDSTDLTNLKKAGFQVVVNSRRGAVVNGTQSQEEVILLNIKDRTRTYNTNGMPARQLRVTLEANRLDASLGNAYISSTSAYNYESRNPLQFGDDVGYNETLERLAFLREELEYQHTPLGGGYRYALPLWESYRGKLMELAKTKHAILFQCRTGYRSSVIAMLVYGCLHNKNSTQMLHKLNMMGYPFVDFKAAPAFQLVKTVLDNREQHCSGSPGSGSNSILFFLFAACLVNLYYYFGLA